MAWKTSYGSLAVGVYRALIDPLLLPLRPRIVRVCHELGVRDVLDIASATGAQCRALGRRGIQATGLDLSESMISVAVRRGGRKTEYVIGSAYELPFPDGSFDASLLILALHEHTEDERSIMLREARRVVRSGGFVVIADYTEPARLGFHVPWQAIRFIESIAGAEHSAGFSDFVARGSLAGLIERHGLRVLDRRSSHLGTVGIVIARPT